MIEIEKIIKELCPNGVEYKPLVECCVVLDNKRKPVTKSARVGGEYPYYGANGIQDYVSDYIFDGVFVLVGEDGSVITSNGNPVVNWAEGKIWVNNHAHIIAEKEGVMLRYLYHFLQTVNISPLVHGNIPKLTGSDFKAIQIPLPPLVAQREIVRVLDKFTLLSQELAAELAARKAQYEFYRDKLLTFDDIAGGGYNLSDLVKWSRLGDIATIVRGASPRPIYNFITSEEDGVNWIKIGDTTVGSKYITSTEEKITKEGAKKSRAVKAGDFILSNSMSFGRPYILKIDGCIHDGWLAISDFQSSYISDFLFHLLSSNMVQKDLAQRASFGGAVSNLKADTVRDLMLPVPPLDIQKRIVEVLDNFDAICSDLKIGLPAEIEKRQQQYEYYRDKLLTFDIKSATMLDRQTDRQTGLIRLLQYVYGYKRVTIKSVFKRLKGTPITAGKMHEISSEDGEIRIFAGGKTVIDAYEKDIPNANITRVPAVLVQSRGVVDFIYYDKPFTFKNEMWAYTTDNLITLRYLYYVLKHNVKYFRESASGMGSLPQISLSVTEDYVITLPPIDRQEYIVKTLDKFDKLVNDLSDGLPAEIEARQKQYEYYRDKLLTFKEIS